MLTLSVVQALLERREIPSFGHDAWARTAAASDYLARRVASGDLIYGVNTGFGSLQTVPVGSDDLAQLQVNLLRSHACGTGAIVRDDVVRVMLLLKAFALAQGHSGVRPLVVQRLLDFLRHDIRPVVYAQGSLGASGDLAPLAHLSLPLLGEGEVRFNDDVVPAAVALELVGLEPLTLGPKEGLALINGTQFMTAHGVIAALEVERLSVLADMIGALSVEAFNGALQPFDARVHAIRPHAGQGRAAARVRACVEGSDLHTIPREQLQDPYSFRAIPQVHGASQDVLDHVRAVVETEMNSVSDNPLVFADDDAILSAANFHGQPLALAYDYLALAVAELASIAERRVFQLISGKRGLPPYLATKPGLQCGFMIPQYTAASIVSQSKQLCSPASVDSIVSSNGQEDHVSMGANAATRLLTVIDNTRTVLAIELLTAAQAMDFRGARRLGAPLSALHQALRERVPFLTDDAFMAPYIADAVALLRSYPVSGWFDGKHEARAGAIVSGRADDSVGGGV